MKQLFIMKLRRRKNCKPCLTVLAAIAFMVSGIQGSVLCIRNDGHVAVEPAAHNHCYCPQENEANNTDSTVAVSADHSHCTDIIIDFLSLITPARKNEKIPIDIDMLSAPDFAGVILSSHNNSAFNCICPRSKDFTSFYTPLRTIVLLA